MIIYKITNKINGLVYVGQTIGFIENRWKQHLSARSCCRKLKHAIAKYGSDNFTIEQIDNAENLEDLNKKEEFWIESLNSMTPSGYNLIAGGKNRIPSLETRKKRSISMTGLVRGPQTSEHKEKIASLKRGVRQKSENIEKRIKACRKKIVDCSTGIIYQSVKEASECLNLKRPNISTHLKGRSSNCGGRIFKYLQNWDGILLPLLPLGCKIRKQRRSNV